MVERCHSQGDWLDWMEVRQVVVRDARVLGPWDGGKR